MKHMSKPMTPEQVTHDHCHRVNVICSKWPQPLHKHMLGLLHAPLMSVMSCQGYTRSETAATAVRQHCGCMTSKHVPAWSPGYSLKSAGWRAVGCLETTDPAEYRLWQFHGCNVHM